MPSMQFRISSLLALGVTYAALVLGCEEAVETRQTGPDVWNAADMMHDILREGPLDATRSVDGHLQLDAISPEEDARVADAEVTARDLGGAGSPDAGEPDVQSTDRDVAMIGQPDAWGLDGSLPVADADIPRREQRCNDALDDDGDGHVDCEDSDCRGAPVCFDRREVCDDGRDNNGDERIDCDDVTCHLEPGCPPPDVEAFTTEQVEARFLIDCVPCHGPPQPEVQLDLTPPFLDRVLNVPSFQVALPHIKPGDAAQSWIYHKIRYRQLDFMGDGDGMPPEHTWTAQDVQRLGLWIDQLPHD